MTGRHAALGPATPAGPLPTPVVPDSPELFVMRVKLAIMLDMIEGIVPVGITEWGDLHDYVDPNEYGGLTDPDHPNHTLGLAVVARMQDEVTVWLRAAAAERDDPDHAVPEGVCWACGQSVPIRSDSMLMAHRADAYGQSGECIGGRTAPR